MLGDKLKLLGYRIALLIILILIVPYQVDIDYENEDWCPPGEIDVRAEALIYTYRKISYCDGVWQKQIRLSPDTFLHKRQLPMFFELVFAWGKYPWNIDETQYSLTLWNYWGYEWKPISHESRRVFNWEW